MGFKFIAIAQIYVFMAMLEHETLAQETSETTPKQSEGMEITKAKNIHAGIYLVVFGILIDFFMANVVFYKLKPAYFRGHYCQAIAMVTVYICNQIALWASGQRFFDNNYVLLNDLILCGLFVIEIVSGVWVFVQCQYKYYFVSFSRKKTFHRAVGLLIYLFAKAKVAALVYFYCQLAPASVFYFTIGGYFAFVLICYYCWYSRYFKLSQRKVIEFKTSTIEPYADIMKAIESEEFLHNDSIKSFREIELGLDDHSIQSTIYSSVNWSAFEDKIFEIKELDHPGGKFLLTWSNRRDITKYIYGVSSMVVFDDNGDGFVFIKYKHSIFFKNYVLDNCLGRYNTSVDLFREESLPDNLHFLTLFSRGSIDLFSSNINLLVMHRLATTITIFHTEFLIKEKIEVGPNNLHILYVSKLSPKCPLNVIDFDFYWPKIMGKYFMLEFGNDEIFFYFGLMTFNPNYFCHRRNQLELHGKEIYEMEYNLSTGIMNEIIMLSEDLTSLSQTHYYPMVGHLKAPEKRSFFKLKGPLGFGLGFTQISSHSYLVILKNDGVIPFVDFLEILFLRYLHEVYPLPNNSEDNRFRIGEDYVNLFCNKMHMCFYWIIDDEYMEFAETFGFYHLSLISFVQMRIRNPDIRVIRQVIVKAHNFDAKKHKYFDQSTALSNSIDHILSSVSFDWQKIIVSGEDQFRYELFEGSRMRKKQFKDVIFL